MHVQCQVPVYLAVVHGMVPTGPIVARVGGVTTRRATNQPAFRIIPARHHIAQRNTSPLVTHHRVVRPKGSHRHTIRTPEGDVRRLHCVDTRHSKCVTLPPPRRQIPFSPQQTS